MTKNLIRIITALSLVLLMTSSTCWAKAYGPWTMTLYYKYCSGDRYQKWGCKGYIHYKLDYDKTRGNAKSTCDWACNKVYPTGIKNVNCKKGCTAARSQEI